MIEGPLREIIRDEVRAAVRAELESSSKITKTNQREGPDGDTWRSRLWSVEAETRLGLSEVAEALDVSERTVRRYVDGAGDRPSLPSRRGPTGLTVAAGDLRDWLRDVEDGNRFRERGRG